MSTVLIKSLESLAVRADELESVEPSVSYWSRYWIVQRAMSLSKRSPELDAFLANLLDQLERMKLALSEHPEITNKELGKVKIYDFAMKVFDNADREERARRATSLTAGKFLAAAQFLEVCQVFGETSKDINDKRKYSKVQAMRIRGAVVAGIDPNEGRAHDKAQEVAESRSDEIETLMSREIGSSDVGAISGQVEQSDASSNTVATTLNTDKSQSAASIGRVSDEGPLRSSPDPVASETSSFAEPLLEKRSSETHADNVKHLGQEMDLEASQKHARFAISALNYEDVETAIKELRLALRLLGEC